MATALLDELGRGDAVQRAESWRYSRNAIRALSQLDFAPAAGDAVFDAPLREQFEWPQTRGRRLVFVNGRLAPALSDLVDADASVATPTTGVCTLRLGPTAGLVHLVHVAVPGATATRWQARLEVEVAAPRACLVEHQVGASGADVLGVLDIGLALAPQARLEWVSLADLPATTSLVRRATVSLARQAQLRSTHAVFGGRLQRLELGVAIRGEQARLESRGVFVLRGREHADIQLDISHAARDSACDILWRGVADQRARAIFHGGITVEPGADGSDASLSNKNVLLSPHAEIDTKPALVIHADEVKAAHGATVGQIDERALFYLRSRGIALAAARRMLVAAFCAEALAGIDDAALRERIEALAAARLPAPEGAP
ncbi:MAG: Fe-S cluster assembly protein SufD [Dokdonella sp.]|uniref:Fe-S cluster assembly protein SufD n=1 Tax=Dokdonella sp. TaxID=2291710 RepID=UPI0027B92620|nr:Fe-S cluster assembly protein SufD [Dokdonella sp.]MCW5578608.1 Fe-S cluster assembly protein SufD [Dokdonella sp.]